MSGIRTRARGELEAEVMRVLWAGDGSMSAKEIQEVFTGQAPAYTTVLTALDRLEKKGQVVRTGDSPRKVRFHAQRSESEHASENMLAALLDAGDRQAALLSFAGNLADDDIELLRGAITASQDRPRRRK